MAGLRITSIQSEWALSVITGRSNRLRADRMPRDIRIQLCADLGWQCLWTTAKIAPLTLYAKSYADSAIFAHRCMSESVAKFASGGWFQACERLRTKLKVPKWQPELYLTASELKASLRKYRRHVVMPAVISQSGPSPNPPLLGIGWRRMPIHAWF